jgi:hypothetical protein
MRAVQWSIVGAVAASAVLIGSQPAQSAPVRHVSLAEATEGQLAPSQVVLVQARAGQSVSVPIHIDGWTPGPTSVIVLVGRPGSTDDAVPDADLPSTAVLRPENQLAAADRTLGTQPARFSAPATGRYPVFLLLSGLEDACGTAAMAEPPVARSVTQIGVVQVDAT